MPASIAELPEDILVDQLLPLLPIPALLSLTCTSKYFSEVCSDPVLWKRRLQLDFNFSSSGDTARTSGFKLIYKGVHKPKVYVWGESKNGRLGLEPESLPRDQSVPFPTELMINSRVVSLVSGGWSFHALDETGAVHVWGTLHAEVYARSSPDDPWFSEAGVRVNTPVKLHLPVRIAAVSCSRRHSAALDSKHRVWMFTRWGRPNLLTFTGSLSELDRHPKMAHTRVIQVECGWGFTSFLTDDGHVYAIWPTSGMFAYQEGVKNRALDQEGDGHPGRAEDGVVRCLPVEISAEPLMLPDIPVNLPHLRSSIDDEGPEATAYTAPKLVKIAAGEYFIIGLTDQGHVLCIDIMGGDVDNGIDDLREMFSTGERVWEYHPEYCDIREVVTDPVYAPGEDDSPPEAVAPKVLNITHISAHFNYFVAYSPGSSSTVLMSFVKREQEHPIESITRTIHPALQNKDIISIVLGDYHFGALHGDGTLSTWGGYSGGALGLGNPKDLPVGAPGGYATAEDLAYAKQTGYTPEPPDVPHPAPVRFDWDVPGRKRFCFAAAAAGWHFGALVIDLDDYSDEDDQTSLDVPEQKEETTGVEAEKRPQIGLLKPLAKFYSAGKPGWSWKKLGCGCFGE